MLRVKDLSIRYGGIHAVRGISFDVPDGKVISMIGANGAGKSSTLKAITGLIHPDSGEIFFEDENITALESNKIVERGIIMSPEGRRVFANFSVEENLLMGAFSRKDTNQIKGDLDKNYALFPRLLERRAQKAGNLSGGEQQMLAVARALMARPKLLILDEPSLGLAPMVCADIFRTVEEIKSAGTTVLLVEQNARKALSLADYAYVLETGLITISGTGADLLKDERVINAYLGE